MDRWSRRGLWGSVLGKLLSGTLPGGGSKVGSENRAGGGQLSWGHAGRPVRPRLPSGEVNTWPPCSSSDDEAERKLQTAVPRPGVRGQAGALINRPGSHATSFAYEGGAKNSSAMLSGSRKDRPDP
jgi:hypothetical protein